MQEPQTSESYSVGNFALKFDAKLGVQEEV